MKHSVCVIFFIQLWFSIVCGEVDSADRFNCTDPDDYLTTPQIIARHGYQAESHIVTTEDGYLLTVHRISVSKNGTRGKQPVFLQHGLLGSSADWVDGGNKSLAFFLSDAGYDVWLGNARGNVYSRAHVNLSTSSAAFWNFSWHEMGVYDLPAVVYHISNTTGQGGHILYVGHSMGTTMFFVFSSMKPQVAKNIRIMVALAPVAYMTHIKSPIRYLSPWVNDFEFLVKHLGIKEFFPSNKIIKLLSHDCDRAFSKVCENFLFIMCGFDRGEIPDDVLKRVIERGPAGSSMKTVLHFLQEIHNKGNFQNFDYGSKGNMINYNQTSTPIYPLKRIQIPVYIMFANNDVAVSPIDVERLSVKLTNIIGLYEIPLQNFNHLDFVWGQHAPNLVYQPLLKLLVTGILLIVAATEGIRKFIQKYLGINQFLPTDKIKRLLARDCDKTFALSVCDDIIFVMFGYDKDQITDEIMQRLICRGKAGASTKTILHYLQEIREDGNFQNFDYGPNGNTIMYNMTSPPFYPLKYIDVPTFLMFGDNDMVVSPIDAKRLSNKLTKNIGVYEVPFPKFNHVDFLWGKDAPELVYNKLLNQIKNYTQCN